MAKQLQEQQLRAAHAAQIRQAQAQHMAARQAAAQAGAGLQGLPQASPHPLQQVRMRMRALQQYRPAWLSDACSGSHAQARGWRAPCTASLAPSTSAVVAWGGGFCCLAGAMAMQLAMQSSPLRRVTGG